MIRSYIVDVCSITANIAQFPCDNTAFLSILPRGNSSAATELPGSITAGA